MQKELIEKFQEYKDISLKIISILESDEFDMLEPKLSERQNILDDIQKLNFSKEELNCVVDDLHIIDVSERITQTLNLKMNEIKTIMAKNTTQKNARKKYDSILKSNPYIFSKKV